MHAINSLTYYDSKTKCLFYFLAEKPGKIPSKYNLYWQQILSGTCMWLWYICEKQHLKNKIYFSLWSAAPSLWAWGKVEHHGSEHKRWKRLLSSGAAKMQRDRETILVIQFPSSVLHTNNSFDYGLIYLELVRFWMNECQLHKCW